MDYTLAADDARDAKRATTAGAGDVDLISGLDEDVLLRVLELVGDTRDAVRTCVLSRRWLGIWKRVPKLRFASCWPATVPLGSSDAEREAAVKRQYVSCVNDILAEGRDDDASEPGYYVSSFNDVQDLLRTTHSPAVSVAADAATERCAALERAALRQFVSCVDGILAPRAHQSDCAIESLAISYTTGYDSTYGHKLRKLEKLTSAFVDAAQGWIQYAFRRHGLKSFVMDLHGLRRFLVGVGVPLKRIREEEEEEEGKTCPAPLVLLDELPDPPPRMETLHLALGGASVRLPANAAMRFASLVELSLEKMMITNGGARRLLAYLVSPANCPRLQKLHMNQLRLPDDDDSSGEKMKLESSVLSELRIDHVNLKTSLELTTPGLRIFHINHCTVKKLTVSAPRLEEFAFFQLGRRRPRCLEVDGGLRCVRSLKICLWAYRITSVPAMATANGVNVRLLDQCISVTSLEVTLRGHQTSKKDVDMIRSTVPQLPQITSLTVNVAADVFHQDNFGTSMESILTRFSNLRNLNIHLPRFYGMPVSATTYPEHWISMAHMKRVELTGLSATEVWFVKAILASAKRLCMLTLSFTAECWKQEHKMAAYKQMLHNEGMTTSHSGGFTLTCRKQSTHMMNL